MDMNLTSLQSLDDESLQTLIHWLESLPTIPSTAIHTEPAHKAGDEQFTFHHSPVLYPATDNFRVNTYVSQVGLQHELGQLVVKSSANDMDWSSHLQDLPQSPSEASVYSDHTAANIAQSPCSMASDDTAVDISDNGFANDFGDQQKAVPHFDASYDYHVGAFEQGTPSVMYELPSGTSPIQSDPLAFSFRGHMGANTYVQQQQHLPGAVASAQCGMKMPAGDYVVPLTSQLFVDVLDTRPEIAPEGATPTTSRKRASTADGEKPAKKRKQQSTAKTLACPECGSLWARRNNLDTHISSVHNQERPHACLAPGCTRAFSRKHDLKRHFQSDHTDEGSPRRKAPRA